VKYALHFTGQEARGIPEIKFYCFWIVLIHTRLPGGAFSAPAGKSNFLTCFSIPM
jgi:hypothetical protein